jgi:GNAT superfamily N-acetyltransferase
MGHSISVRGPAGLRLRLLLFTLMRDGYTDLPPGKVAAVVTYLEMRTPPFPSTPAMSEFAVRHVSQPDLDWYRELYRVIGEPWLWFSRLRMSDEELRAVIHDPAVDVFALTHASEDHGLLEFDRRRFPDIELSFFGVTPALIGKAAGSALLQHCLPLEWEYKPQRVWLHTCTSDHPGALAFYVKAGFVPYKRAIEISNDPRLTGEMPRTAAHHIPIV